MAEMQGQEQGQGDLGKLISNTGQGLSMLADLAGKTQGVDPSIPERFAALVEEFTGLIEALSGSGEQAPAPMPTGTTSPEQGANPNARPA